MIVLWLAVAVFFLAGSAVHSDQTLSISGDDQHLPLTSQLLYVDDATGSLSLADLQKPDQATQWRKVPQGVPSFGFTSSVYWFRIDLRNDDFVPRSRLLELAAPVLDYVDFHLVSEGHQTTAVHTGDKLPFAQRPIAHRNFVFPFAVEPQHSAQIYLRVQTTSAFQVPLTLWSERAFWVAEQHNLLWHGAYVGTLLVMVLYNLFIYTAVRDRSYLFYVLFVGCFMLVQLTVHGFSYQLLWPRSPLINERALVVSVATALAFGACFTTELLALRQKRPQLHRLFQTLAGLGLCTALAALIAPYTQSMIIALGLTLITCLCSLATGLSSWSRGYAPARYYTIAWGVLLSGAALYVLSKLGVLPRNALTENCLQLGSAAEVLLLSFALASRINITRNEKDQAQAKALAAMAKYQTLYENAIEGIFQFDLDRWLVNLNRAMATALGEPDPAAMLAAPRKSLQQFFVHKNDAEDFMNQLQTQGKVKGYEAATRRTDGSEFWASWSAAAVYDETHQTTCYEGSLVDISDRRRAAEQIHYLAYFDELTGLPNRSLLREYLHRAVEISKRERHSLAVLWFDLNRFKPVNDTFGHDAGDELLRQVAKRLADGLRRADALGRMDACPIELLADGEPIETVARLGGDEFVMVLTHIHGPDDAALVATRVNAALRLPFSVRGRELHISASVGIALYPDDGRDAETLLRNADIAMYYAKKRGASFQFHSRKIDAQVAERLALESDIRTSLVQEGFSLYYQPRVNLSNEDVTGFEALCRWNHPHRGYIYPAEFIPIAEESGLIEPLGNWVLQTACLQSHAWCSGQKLPGRISINLSARQFRDQAFTDSLKNILRQTGVDPAGIELELTESTLMDDIKLSQRVLQELKDQGLHISIDDFGTGYSSLSYLKHFPVDALKIDRSFIKDITSDTDNQAITAAIISLGQRLDLNVIAEGIETYEQYAFLRRFGCNEGQGYYFGAPSPVEAINFSEAKASH